jgi:hypothetical protein
MVLHYIWCFCWLTTNQFDLINVVSTMIFIAKVRGLSAVCKVMHVSTNIVFSTWHHPTSPRVGFKRKLYHFLFSFPFATVHCKTHCALQNSLRTAKLTVQNSMCVALQNSLQNSLCAAKFTAKSPVHRKIVFLS